MSFVDVQQKSFACRLFCGYLLPKLKVADPEFAGRPCKFLGTGCVTEAIKVDGNGFKVSWVGIPPVLQSTFS